MPIQDWCLLVVNLYFFDFESMMKKTILFICIILAYTNNAAGQDYNKEQEDFCRYIKTKAAAEQVILKSPDVVFDLTTDGSEIEGTKNTVFLGLSKNLADLNKSKYVQNLADTECRLYEVNDAIKDVVNLSLKSIEKVSLEFKKQEIQRTMQTLKKHFNVVESKFKVQNATLVNIYDVQTLIKKFNVINLENDLEIAKIQQSASWPDGKPLNAWIKQLAQLESDRYDTLNQIQKQDNWNLSFRVGMKKTGDSSESLSLSGSKLYAALSASYNLGSSKRNQLLDESKDYYMHWKGEDNNGHFKQLGYLVNEIMKTREIEERKLAVLANDAKNNESLESILEDFDSSEAENFKLKVLYNKLANNIDAEYSKYKIQRLNQLLKSIDLQ